MGGSCDSDCNNCEPEKFCHQYPKPKKGVHLRNAYLSVLESHGFLFNLVEKVRLLLVDEINNYDADSLLHTVIKVEEMLRGEL